jgi:hypothetical protein
MKLVRKQDLWEEDRFREEYLMKLLHKGAYHLLLLTKKRVLIMALVQWISLNLEVLSRNIKVICKQAMKNYISSLSWLTMFETLLAL